MVLVHLEDCRITKAPYRPGVSLVQLNLVVRRIELDWLISCLSAGTPVRVKLGCKDGHYNMQIAFARS